MGYNTPVLIYNDMLSSLKRDQDIGPKIDSAIARAFMTQEPEHIYAVGGSIGIALPSAHADVSRTVVVGGNDVVEIGSVWNGGHLPHTEEERVLYLKRMAGILGYDLHRKRGRT